MADTKCSLGISYAKQVAANKRNVACYRKKKEAEMTDQSRSDTIKTDNTQVIIDMQAEIDRLRARLEIDRTYSLENGKMIKNAADLPEECDGIACRDLTIDGQRNRIDRLEAQADALSGTIESQKQTHDALIKRLERYQQHQKLLWESLKEICNCTHNDDGLCETCVVSAREALANGGE